MGEKNKTYRISFIVGSLVQGGAEKQLLYILRTLKKSGVQFQAILLTRSEYYEKILSDYEIPTIPVGNGSVIQRLIRICKEVRKFRPDFIQATHFFASFYAGAAGKILKIPSIGAIRGDFYHDLSGINRFGKYLLFLPDVYVANSHNARQNAISFGLKPQRVFVLGNVIDISEFDQLLFQPAQEILPKGNIYLTVVARLIKVKRLDRYLRALAQAKEKVPNLFGIIIGDGPEMNSLVSQATELGLLDNGENNGITFLGKRSDIPQLLKQSDIFVLTSDQEGFPNVFLEAMAASLPIISTPAGETPQLIQNGENGYIVKFDDQDELTGRMIELALSQSARFLLGSNGRKKVLMHYDFNKLDQNLEMLYTEIKDYLQGQRTGQKRQTQGMSKQV